MDVSFDWASSQRIEFEKKLHKKENTFSSLFIHLKHWKAQYVIWDQVSSKYFLHDF